MRRRTALAAAGGLWLPAAWAHHGWSSFDLSRPLYLEGKAVRVAWRNPHAELDLELPASPALPPDLASRPVPAQTAAVDGPKLLSTARLPARKDKVWRVELAPLSRLDAWKVPPVVTGATVAVLGFTFAEEQGDALLRAEYLWTAGGVYGLRSSPA